MDSVCPEKRAYACNVLFLDAQSIPFAGLYQDPNKPIVHFQQALQELANSFHLEFEDSGHVKMSGPWRLQPSEQSRFKALGNGKPCNELLPAKSLYSTDGNMMEPILPGGYYVRRMKNVWKCVGGAVPLAFQLFQTKAHPAEMPSMTAFSPTGLREISVHSVSSLTKLRKKPNHCRPKNTQCAISGLGRPSKWADTTKVPGLFAYPIVPDEMLVDVPHDEDSLWGDDDDDGPSSGNWVTMLSHIYEFFAAGLIAIHPDTMVIRCFSPSRIIRPYHGRVARSKNKSLVHRQILGLHYEQCVHANMTAHAIRSRQLMLEDWQISLAEGNLSLFRSLDIVDATAQKYCTQLCLRGLFEDSLPLDPNCPNFKTHQVVAGDEIHDVGAAEVCLLFQEQLKHDQSIYCKQPRPSTQGHHGQFFKLTQATYGYTLVGKGVWAGEQHKLANEAKMYYQMKRLQGECVPVCLGVFALQAPCGQHAGTYEEITHMLLLSHAGTAVENEYGDDSMLPVDEDVVAMEATRTFDEINRSGVDRSDQRKKHQFWNEEKGRVFFIDFEKDHLHIKGTPKEAAR